MNDTIISCYYVTHRGQLRRVLHSLETFVLSGVENVASASVQNKHIGTAAKSAHCLVAAMAISIYYVAWAFIPLISTAIPVISGEVERKIQL